jgi:hypothetical protein
MCLPAPNEKDQYWFPHNSCTAFVSAFNHHLIQKKRQYTINTNANPNVDHDINDGLDISECYSVETFKKYVKQEFQFSQNKNNAV